MSLNVLLKLLVVLNETILLGLSAQLRPRCSNFIKSYLCFHCRTDNYNRNSLSAYRLIIGRLWICVDLVSTPTLLALSRSWPDPHQFGPDLIRPDV